MESQTKDETSPHSRRRRRICLRAAAIVAAVVVALAIVLAILSQTVFKPKRPVTTVTSVSLKDVDASLFGANGVTLNVTVGVDLTVENPNRVGFRYRDSTAELSYRGDEVGVAAIPHGEIAAGETARLNVTLTVMADRLLSRSEVYSDVLAGNLPLSSHTKMIGKATILGIFKLRVVSTTFCDFIVDVSSRNVTSQRCTYKTKL